MCAYIIACILRNGEVIKCHIFISVVVIEFSVSCLNTGPEDRLTVFFEIRRETIINVRKKAKFRNLHVNKQVPHLTQDTIWERDKHTRKHHIQKSQEVSHFQAGEHNAAKNRLDCITDKHETHITKRIYKKAQPRRRSVKQILEGLNMFDGMT